MEMASEATGIPPGTLKNATRELAPQPIRLARVYELLRALNQSGFEQLTIDDILVGGADGGVPDEPPSKTQEKETNTGPGRDGSGGTGTGKGGSKSGPKRPSGAAA